MNKREKKIFEKLKNGKITLEHLKKAKEFSRHLGKMSSKFSLLLRMMNSDFKGEFKIATMDKIKIIGAILYVITPFDALADFVPFFGFGDDIAVVSYVLTKLNDLIIQYENFEKAQKKSEKDKNVDFENLKVVNEEV